MWSEDQDLNIIKKYIGGIKKVFSTIEEKLSLIIKECKKDNIDKIVVGGIIEEDNRVLLLQRPYNDFMGGIYELPSGNVEKDEDLIYALKREILEETNLNMSNVINVIDTFDYVSGSGKRVRQINFLVSVERGEIVLSEHDNYCWSNLNDEAYNHTTASVKKTIQKFNDEFRGIKNAN